MHAVDIAGGDFDNSFLDSRDRERECLEQDPGLPGADTIANSFSFDDLLKSFDANLFDANDIQSQFESSSSNIIDDYQILDDNAIKTTSIRKIAGPDFL
jgi:hypothetical protein